MTVYTKGPCEARIQLEAPADRYVYFGHVTSPRESTRFSDNYLDLLPGEVREIVVSDPSGAIRVEDLHLGWA